MSRIFALCALGLLLAGCGGPKSKTQSEAAPAPAAAADANEAAVKPVQPVDYVGKSAWLCRPGADEACSLDITTTIVGPDGKLTKEAFKPDPNAPIDCFYVYPTVSLEQTPNADMTASPELSAVAAQQIVRFGAACRLYVPIYRQVTLPALRQMLRGEATASDREMAYADVKAAWERYLANDNAGRGVVLIGHDQGAGILIRLLANQIEGKPAQAKLVSAILLGSTVETLSGKLSGGSFKSVPLCASADETGCIIAYSSFRADKPPPADSLFGKAPDQGMEAACVNPAELEGSKGALKAYLPAKRVTVSGEDPPPWTSTGAQIETLFVAVPGLLSAKCVDQAGFRYLAITTNGDPADARTDSIAGDVVVDGKIQPAWGLHLYDLNLAMGNLVEIVKRQAKAYAAKPAAPP